MMSITFYKEEEGVKIYLSSGLNHQIWMNKQLWEALILLEIFSTA